MSYLTGNIVQNRGAALSSGAPARIDVNGHNNVNGTRQTDDPISNEKTLLGHHDFTPMAICGMACRLPGGIKSPSELWEFLLNKGDAKIRVPKSRYNIDAYHSASGKSGTVRAPYGYFLEEDLSSFDASFFTMSPNEISRCDPQQRQMLEVARECIVDAGETKWKGEDVGVFIGNFGDDWAEMLGSDPQQYGGHLVLGANDFSLANRVSYEMGLTGPSVTIRTACSAALVALDAACTAIARGDCTSAIVGGTSLIMAPSMTAKMEEMGVLSPDGSCKAFSADADGYARAEAINAVYIKPLGDALRDKSPVRAVLRATAVNNNGKSKSGGIASPNMEAQKSLIQHAYKLAGITDVSQTAFFECHGTGTMAGDTAETNAIAQVFGGSGMYIGSVKANVGHSEGASGLTSLIKAVLALENKTIPPNIKFTTPNPNIPFEEGKLTVPLEALSWPEDRLPRVSVNSFGIGGTNAHAILDSAASHSAGFELLEASYSPQLLLYSANTPESLATMVKNFESYLSKHPEKISDIAYTLATKRQHLRHRTFVVANRDRVGHAPPVIALQNSLKVVMVFTGQGAQWPSMGRDLFRENSHFRDSIKHMDECLAALGDEGPTWKIEQELRRSARTSRLGEAELSQPICTAIQIALVDTLASFGIQADAVVGHSSGEIAAAYAAGALTAEEAIIAAFYRGRIANEQKRAGSMAAVGMSWEDTHKYLVSNVTIACDNSPRSVTISGDSDQVEQVIRNINKSRPDALTRVLKVNKAYHSYHMSEIGDQYENLISSSLQVNRARKPFFSSVTGDFLPEVTALDANYWRSNLECPVLFRSAVSRIAQHTLGQNALFVEVGPHSALAGPLLQIMAENAKTNFQYVATMIRDQRCTETLLAAVGKMHCLGVPVDFESLYPSDTHQCLTGLPGYPFDRINSYWHETRLTKDWRQAQHRHHDLLGSRVRESSDLEPAWRNLFHLQNAPWVRDHRVEDEIVLPFAAYVAMAGEAVRQMAGAEYGFRIRGLLVRTAMIVSDDYPTELVTNLRRRALTKTADSQWWEFSISSSNDGIWTKHCSGEVTSVEKSLGTAEDRGELPRQLSSRRWYNAIRDLGVDYGYYFQGLDDIRTSTSDPGRATATIKNRSPDDSDSDYHLHPTILDAALQLLACGAAMGHTRRCSKVLATSIEDLEISRCRSDLKCSVTAAVFGKGSVVGSGECVAGRDVFLRMKSARLLLLGENKTDNKDAAARSVWAPHIDFLAEDSLVPTCSIRSQYAERLAKLGQLAIVYSRQSLKDVKAISLSHKRLKTLLESESWGLPSLESSNEFTRDLLLDEIHASAQGFEDRPARDAASAIVKLATSIPIANSENRDLVDILNEGDSLEKFRAFVNEIDMSSLISHLKHLRPNIRILELRAGTGTATRRVLDNIDGSYSKYTFSDSSNRLFSIVQEKFQGVKNLDFEVLDIGADLESQGFGEKEYDLIIATNVIHGTADVTASLENVRQLLSPDGRIFLQELDPTCRWAHFVLSLDAGFMPNTSGTPLGGIPYRTMDEWKIHLTSAGFMAPHVARSDAKAPLQVNNVLVARKAPNRSLIKKVTLLTTHRDDNIDAISEELRRRGYCIFHRSVDEDPEPDTDVISILDRDGPFIDSLTADTYERFKVILDRVGTRNLVWITHLSPVDCSDPRYAQVLGLSRTLRTEAGMRFTVIQSDCGFDDPRLIDVFERIQTDEGNVKQHLLPEYEYALCKDQIMIGRWFPVDINEELARHEESDSARLEAQKTGIHAELGWTWTKPREPVANEVEVEVYSSALNERDVAMATELDESLDSGFGNEGAGVIRRVGPMVKDLRVGDRVIVCGGGTLSVLATVPAILCVKIQDGLSFSEAATIGRAYAKATYSLVDVGGLTSGQSVFIHDAYSAMGTVAVQIALELKAQVFVTVNNDLEAKNIVSFFDIPRNRVFSSTDSSFLGAIEHATNGRGVDLVLNSLTGELSQASWQCVAEFGKLVEFGKKDLSRIDLNLLLQNRGYCLVDFNRIESQRPEFMNRLLHSAVNYYQQGHVKFMFPIKTFRADQIQDAFRHVQQGARAESVVVELRAPDRSSLVGDDVTQRKMIPVFSTVASYLLVGGLGGIGRAVSVWLAEHGVRHIIFLSRSAGDRPEHRALKRELNSLGCRATLIKGDVTDIVDTTRAIEAAGETAIKGVIQMSMVLRDRVWQNMTWEDWHESRAPKIKGTWNLHTLLADKPLDFFIVFSSISGIVGNASQANYASANTFMEALCQYRRRMGQKASTINVGTVLGIGAVGENESLSRRLMGMGLYGLDENVILNALAVAVNMPSEKLMPVAGETDSCSISLGMAPAGPINFEDNHSAWRKEPRMAAFRMAASSRSVTGEAKGDEVRMLLNSARQDPAVLREPGAANTLTYAIGLKVLNLLFRPEEDYEAIVKTGLSDIGMDSLVAMEMRSWWKQTFDIDIKVLDMLRMGNLELLGKYAADELAKAFTT
ncbi:acyl transferase domain-containing protein [Xylaria venustula]|nr:acyl transferase domain-containing protein [Xylaria venustula]